MTLNLKSSIDSSQVTIGCPHCKHKLRHTIGWFRAHKNIACAGCSKTFTVDLSQLAGYVAEDLRRQAPERSVVWHIEPGMQVLGDPTLLRLVVENLLGNAWKYTAKCRQPEVWFERRNGEADTYSVRDNGAGFDMRFADRLFGVFQRLHSASDFQGTGVGLASVRRIVRRHGGEIWAEAEVDRGASFHFSLPRR